MVKVKDGPMAEAKPATTATTTTQSSTINNNNTTNSNSTTYTHIRKPRNHNHTHHIHPLHHYTYLHHHCTHPSDNAETNGSNGAGSPAKFHFGPGFEPQISGGNYCPGPSQSQNNSEYVVLFHVNPGVTIRFQMGDSFEVLQGPVTVPMVSTNSSPPIAMPVQVPPGHVVQQIVDESGTLRHVILSPQHPAGLVPLTSHNPQHYGAGPGNSTNQPQQAFYQGLPTGFPASHFHSNIPPGHPGPSPTRLGHSPPLNQIYYKDERAKRQYIKLKKKHQDKQKLDSMQKDLVNGLRRPSAKDKDMNSVGTSEDGEESSIPDEEDSVQIIADILSSVQAPKVSELSSRSALLLWAPPTKLSEASSTDGPEIDVGDLRYEVLLSDKSKEMKFKSIYNGTSLSCRIRDLKPGQEYSVCLQVHYDELQGAATDPVKFTTPPCEPDQPQPPKLHQRQKTSLQLKWNSVNDNGSHITNYILEYDEGKGGDFVEFHRGRVKQYTIHKLQPATPYKFRLAAVNEIGKSSYSEVVTYNTCNNPPTKPPPPVLAEASINYLHLQWSKRPSDEEFTLQMNDSRTSYRPVYNGRETICICTGLSNFTEYKFRLRAENDGGQSPWSDEVTYKTLPDRPREPSKPVVKGRIHAHSFKLKWEPPNYTGGADITEYILEVNSGSGYEVVYTGTETEAVCDKLTPGTTYQLRASCISAGGRSNYSNPCTVTTDAIAPGQCAAPRLHGKPKSNSITIRWCEPDYNGGAPVLEYEVEMAGPPDHTRNLVHKSKETECTAANLTPGCEYEFFVRAVNRIGPGLWSDPLKVTSGAAPPDVVSTLTTNCKSPFQIFVEWQEPPSNGAPILDYRLEISTSMNDFHLVYQGAENYHDVKGLNPFTTYYFRVQACNSAGCSPYSPVTATVTPAAPPSTVTTLRSESTPTSITLNWNEPSNNGSEITHYNIEFGDKLIVTDGPVREYQIVNLQPEITYKIKIQAVNAIGSGSLSSTLKVSTLKLPPAAPKLECIGIGHNYLKLKWGDGKNVDYTHYLIEMENGRTHDFQCVYKGTALTYKVNKLQEVTTYRFRICASNDAGVGDFSNIYEFTTSIAPPAVIKQPKLIEVDQTSCMIEWMPSKNQFVDPVIFQVQVARVKDQFFKETYRGAESKCSIENLEPGVEYSARVCPIRLTASGDLVGPSSPLLHFSTMIAEPTVVSKISTNPSSPTHSHRSHRTALTSILHRLKTVLNTPLVVAIVVTIIGIIISIWIMSFL
ncbi:fibronectin type-III domain-containing protein 3A isoform X2 [Tribolium madens]|uniref:fibronectin type-III domain-containing protein 3A isoform X2 n=1 Tax=Tribolium madens TaxID=41895 RepID=UPI001CF760BA|nr:fibronectin type-III domain-containing protein 3A isoform X2 [Tribolium madens]